MGKVAVLGLGPSLDLYNQSDIEFDFTIGVNDIWSKVKTDYVVCVDKKERFTPERLKTIEECKPVKFFSHLDEWNNHSGFEKIELQPDFPKYICQVNLKSIPKSLCSPFIAAAMAYKLGAKEIHLYGVDLTTHPHLSKDIQRIQLHFHNLKVALSMNNCLLIIHGDGALKGL